MQGVLDLGRHALEALSKDRGSASALSWVDEARAALQTLTSACATHEPSEPDEEVVNWMFAETLDRAAVAAWCLAGGSYPVSMEVARNVLDLGLAAGLVAWVEPLRDQGATLPAAFEAVPSLSDWEQTLEAPDAATCMALMQSIPAVRSAFGELDGAAQVQSIGAGLARTRLRHHLGTGLGLGVHDSEAVEGGARALLAVLGVILVSWCALFPTVRAAARGDASLVEAMSRDPWTARWLAS